LKVILFRRETFRTFGGGHCGGLACRQLLDSRESSPGSVLLNPEQILASRTPNRKVAARNFRFVEL
jgi:hypothetical protein